MAAVAPHYDLDGHSVVSREEWLEARKELLAAEKAFTCDRDWLAQPYPFEGPRGSARGMGTWLRRHDEYAS